AQGRTAADGDERSAAARAEMGNGRPRSLRRRSACPPGRRRPRLPRPAAASSRRRTGRVDPVAATPFRPLAVRQPPRQHHPQLIAGRLPPPPAVLPQGRSSTFGFLILPPLGRPSLTCPMCHLCRNTTLCPYSLRGFLRQTLKGDDMKYYALFY